MYKHAKSGGDIYLNCLPLCVISPSSVLIHRSIFDKYGYFDESLPACEDYDLWLRICAHESVTFISEAQITKYGGHEDQLSRQHWGMDRFRIQALEKSIKSPKLKMEYRIAAINTVVKKSNILALGARKRDAESRAEYYEYKQQYYQAMLESL
jgi:GT2 family glycosyltransferase